MKKILLSAGMLICAIATQAQDCKAVATLNENFNGFTTNQFPQNCWSKITTGPLVYITGTTDKAATFYASSSPNVSSYIVSPELSTINGKHQLSFTAALSAGSAAGGVATLQVGTLATAGDASTFVAVGTPIAIDYKEAKAIPSIVIPTSATQKYIAFQITGNVAHTAAIIDNVVYEAVPAPICESVATLDENFSTFAISSSFATAFPQKCWNSAGSAASGPWIYTAETTDKSNQYITFYSHMTGANVPGYVISPELSTIDGIHELSFETFKPTGPNGQAAPGAITVQVGTLKNFSDMGTFEAVGTPYDVTDKPVTHPNIVIPASTTAKYVAFKFISATPFNAATLDNIKWAAKTAGIIDLAKNKFSIFPNPSSDKNVTIAYAGADKANVTVFSVTGAKVFETIVNGTKPNLNLSSLSSGMYIIKLTAGNATATQKLVIQ